MLARAYHWFDRPDAMGAFMPVEAWFVLSTLLAPVGFALQGVVADAMTVEAVPRDIWGQSKN